jgi:hypothetical protein
MRKKEASVKPSHSSCDSRQIPKVLPFEIIFHDPFADGSEASVRAAGPSYRRADTSSRAEAAEDRRNGPPQHKREWRKKALEDVSRDLLALVRERGIVD